MRIKACKSSSKTLTAYLEDSLFIIDAAEILAIRILGFVALMFELRRAFFHK
jgi:hypothetical protein